MRIGNYQVTFEKPHRNVLIATGIWTLFVTSGVVGKLVNRAWPTDPLVGVFGLVFLYSIGLSVIYLTRNRLATWTPNPKADSQDGQV